ncbi:MAG TPA: hypothetical protein VFY85_11395 [Gemmatimonadaceae bacterium]|nr:hypothetical protein [Gemmatimonadaceae bacterium]
MRLRYLLLAMSGVVVASSACSTDATSPLPLTAPESAGLSKGGLPDGKAKPVSGTTEDDSSTYVIQVDPRRDNYLQFGKHSLWLPANSICDPSTSSYGMGTWDQACSPLTTKITITAKVRSTIGGLPRIDFEPALRFNPKRTVYLTLAVRGKQAKEAVAMRILYCPTSASKYCVDEALTDPSLDTVLDRQLKLVYRRIKHFSGYLVAERSLSGELY